jgi:hypothetical protein
MRGTLAFRFDCTATHRAAWHPESASRHGKWRSAGSFPSLPASLFQHLSMFVPGRFFLSPFLHRTHSFFTSFRTGRVTRYMIGFYASRFTPRDHNIPTLLWSPRVILSALGLMGERVMIDRRPMRLSSMRYGMFSTWLYSRTMLCSISLSSMST